MEEDISYYVRRQGRVEGPWTLAKLLAEVQLRKLGRYHEVSEDGQTWKRAGDLEQLFPHSEIRKTKSLPNGSQPAHDPTSIEEDRDTEWFCVVHDEQRGPMPLHELGQLVSSGFLSREDLVWREGLEEWAQVEQVPELAAFSVAERDRSQELTDATRVVELVKREHDTSLPLIAAAAAGVLLLPSCIPLVGLLGVIPVVLSVMAIYDIRIKNANGMPYAITGLILGLLEVLLGITLLLISLLNATSYLDS